MAKLKIENGKLVVPNNITIPYIAGDGVGAEISPVTQSIIDTAVKKCYAGERKMLDYEKLSYGLYDAVSQAMRLIEQEQQHCEEACMQSGTPDYRALYFHLFAVTEAVRRRLSKIEDE